MFFIDRDNIIKDETKPIIKLNSQLTLYLRIKSKKLIKKVKFARPMNQVNQPNL
jgi:hypothetical protein